MDVKSAGDLDKISKASREKTDEKAEIRDEE